MFVGGLDHRTTDEKLKAYFEQYGTVIDVIVMKDPKTKRYFSVYVKYLFTWRIFTHSLLLISGPVVLVSLLFPKRPW